MRCSMVQRTGRMVRDMLLQNQTIIQAINLIEAIPSVAEARAGVTPRLANHGLASEAALHDTFSLNSSHAIR